MKLIKIEHLLALALALAITAGCKTKTPPITRFDGPGGTPTGLGDGGKLSLDQVGAGGGAAADFNPDLMQQDRTTLAADTVYFGYDSAAVRSDESSKVDAVASALRSDGSAKLLIEGHCDERGTEEYNRSLGEQRALAIREALAMLGIDPSRIATRTYGEDRPADSGQGESSWSRNRRGEFVLLH